MAKKTNTTKIKDFQKYIEYRTLHEKIRLHGGLYYDYMLSTVLEEIEKLEEQFKKEIEDGETT